MLRTPNRFLCLLLLSFSLSVNNSSNADPVLLKANQAAPFEGILFNSKEANDIRVQLLERDLYKDMTASYATSVELLKKNDTLNTDKVNILLEQNDKLSLSLKDAQSTSDFQKVLYFGLGIVATVAAGYTFYGIAK